MFPVWLALSIAAADPGICGFDRLHVDPEAFRVEPTIVRLPPKAEDLVLDNRHTSRVRVEVDDTSIGELLPRQRGVLRTLTAGTYTVRYHLPGGAVRTEVLTTQPAAEDPC